MQNANEGEERKKNDSQEQEGAQFLLDALVFFGGNENKWIIELLL